MKKNILALFITTLLLVACGSPEPATQPVVDTTESAVVEEVEVSADTELVAENTHDDDDHSSEEKEDDHGHEHADDDDSHTEAIAFDTSSSIINFNVFNTAGFVSDPAVVDCVLTDGTSTQCAKFVTKYLPDNIELQKSCPETMDDLGGIWYWASGENEGLYRLQESFWLMLNDQGYVFYDEAGNINIEDPGPEGPNAVLEGNNCIEIAPDETAELTILIPLNPTMAETTTRLGITGQVGLALTSIPIFGSAPSVARTNNMPALDTCGGHMDPGGWYHWHATATDIETIYALEGVDAECYLEQAAGGIFAYAYDGFPIYGSSESDGTTAAELDECNGHVAPTAEYPDGIYHYHASLTFPNLPNCLVGLTAETAIASNGDTAIPGGNGGGRGGGGGGQGGGQGGPPPGGEGGGGEGGGGQGGPPPGGGGGRIDFSAAAEVLGLGEQQLRDAIGGPPPDLDGASDALGISVEALQEALGVAQP